jgi:hypothetical protein
MMRWEDGKRGRGEEEKRGRRMLRVKIPEIESRATHSKFNIQNSKLFHGLWRGDF